MESAVSDPKDESEQESECDEALTTSDGSCKELLPANVSSDYSYDHDPHASWGSQVSLENLSLNDNSAPAIAVPEPSFLNVRAMEIKNGSEHAMNSKATGDSGNQRTNYVENWKHRKKKNSDEDFFKQDSPFIPLSQCYDTAAFTLHSARIEIVYTPKEDFPKVVIPENSEVISNKPNKVKKEVTNQEEKNQDKSLDKSKKKLSKKVDTVKKEDVKSFESGINGLQDLANIIELYFQSRGTGEPNKHDKPGTKTYYGSKFKNKLENHDKGVKNNSGNSSKLSKPSKHTSSAHESHKTASNVVPDEKKALKTKIKKLYSRAQKEKSNIDHKSGSCTEQKSEKPNLSHKTGKQKKENKYGINESFNAQPKESGDSPAGPGKITLTKRVNKAKSKFRKNHEPEERVGESESNSKAKVKTARPKKPKLKLVEGDIFEEYLEPSKVAEGLKDKTLFQGELRISKNNPKSAYVSTVDGNDILIKGLAFQNRALEGDIVVVRLLQDAVEPKDVTSDDEIDVKPLRQGKVVAITQKTHNRVGIGYVSNIEGSYAVLVPRDLKLPLVAIPAISMPVGASPSVDIIYSFQIVTWEHTGYATGTLIRELGAAGDIDVEKTAIHEFYDIDPLPVPESLEVHLPPFPYSISIEEIAKRKDFRDDCIFTIDPPTARDLDDALSIKMLEDGLYELGVHISDVSHFLAMDTPLDEFISKRATSVYFVDNVYHMLPQKLCTLCSLLPGEDKLAFSVIFIMDGNNGEVKKVDFHKSVIRSCAQLSYIHAQSVIDGDDCELPCIYNGYSDDDIKAKIKMLDHLAQALRAKRTEYGYLRLNQPKPCFELDVSFLPTAAQEYIMRESNRLVEEFMLLANTHVATALLNKFPKIALLRKHPPPKESVLKGLKEDFEGLGIFLNTSSASELQNSINKYFTGDPNFEYVLSYYLVKSMQRAVYTCSSDTHHYALNVPVYTHFTSPIRRYADVVVHRLLSAHIGVSEVPTWTTENVLQWAHNCNRRKLLAQRASEKCNELFAALYVNRFGPVICQGVVTRVTKGKIEVLVRGLVIHVFIKTKKLPVETEFIAQDFANLVIVNWSKDYSQQISVFSNLELKLTCTAVPKGINAELVQPGN